MAIVVEEERNNTNGLIRIIGWIVVFVVLAMSAYYIFFAAPELVVITPTGALSNIAPIVQVNLNPETVIKSSAFQALQPSSVSVTTSTGAPAGRPNPFIAP